MALFKRSADPAKQVIKAATKIVGDSAKASKPPRAVGSRRANRRAAWHDVSTGVSDDTTRNWR